MVALIEAQRTTTPAEHSEFDRMSIGGEWRFGQSSKVNRDKNPFTGEILVEIPQASVADLEEAYASAAKAQRAWAAKTPGERAAVMRQAAAVTERRHDEIVSWLIRESGSTKLKASLEWQTVHAVMLEASTLPYLVEGRILPSDLPGKESRSYRRPVGIVAVISPFNWPLQLSARSVCPALAVGNAVVLKPASDTPVTGALLLAKIFDEAGLPDGVLNAIVGAGSEIGDQFGTHPVPRVVSFTGSTPVGRGIAKLAAESPIIKRVELELGGNSPFVVLDDADLEHAIEAGIFGKFLHQGQICMIANRFLVAERIYDEFVHGFSDRTRKLKWGDPEEEDTLIGPIINQSQFDRLVERIEEARATGAREEVGGRAEGLVLPPHVFSDVSNDHPLAREELFGPVAPIIRVKDDDEALRFANATPYGLSSTVFTRDLERGLRFAKQVEAGMTHINDQPVNDLPFSPFGGEKNSGIGRFNGRWAVDAFTTDHSITVQHEARRYPINAREMEGPWAGG